MGSDDLLWQRQQRSLRRAAPGTLGGRVESPGRMSIRKPQLEKMAASGIETFSGSWPTAASITAGHSGRGYLTYSHATITLTLAAGVAPTADLVLGIYENGVLIGNVTLTALSNGPATGTFSGTFEAGNFLTYLGSGGTGVGDITAKAVLT